MHKQPVIAASYVRSMMRVATERGLDGEVLLADTGISPDGIRHNQPVSVELYSQLYQRIVDLLSQEWFGMLSGDAVPKGAVHHLCLLAVHCNKLGDAISRCGDFFELCRGFKIKQTCQRGDQESLFRISKLSTVDVEEFNLLIADTSPGVIKATISMLHGFNVWLVGQDVPIKAIYYTFPEQKNTNKVTRSYPIYYNQDFCGYAIDSKFLDYPIIKTEENIEDFTHRAPYYVFIKNNYLDNSITQQVKTILLKNLSKENLNAQNIAGLLNISATSLYRKLNRENTSYQRIKDETRLEAIMYYLNQTSIKTTEIAALVGFDSPSMFYRSFKKWTNLTPMEYRSRLV